MPQKNHKSEKISNLLEIVAAHLERGTYLFTSHALSRKEERSIRIPDILHVLRTGFHEKIKDQWDLAYNDWNYSIRGKAVDGQDLRIIVSINLNLVVITVIKLER